MAARNSQRLRQVPWVACSSGQNQNPNSFPSVPGFNQNHVDLILSSFLSLPDVPSLSLPLSINCSLDQALDNLFEASSDESVNRGIQLASLLHESALRSSRKRATIHNSNSWPLPRDLTVKVFSMLDTKSLVRASACCTMFKTRVKEPLCYSHIDLTTGNVISRVVRNMMLNAGKELRSLKVGRPKEAKRSLLSGSCLDLLSYNHRFLGNLLRTLHINNNKWLETKCLCEALSVCSNLTDLKIVGLDVDIVDRVLGSLTRKCQHLFLEQEIGSCRSRILSGLCFKLSCPDLTTLSLIGFDLSEEIAYTVIMSLGKLKYLDLSRSFSIQGCFLRDVSNECKDSMLETLILRNCFSLEERKVCGFLNSLRIGRLRSIRHIDISNSHGLMNGGRTSNKPKLPLEELKIARPGLTFIADFRSSSSSSFSPEVLVDVVFGGVVSLLGGGYVFRFFQVCSCFFDLFWICSWSSSVWRILVVWSQLRVSGRLPYRAVFDIRMVGQIWGSCSCFSSSCFSLVSFLSLDFARVLSLRSRCVGGSFTCLASLASESLGAYCFAPCSYGSDQYEICIYRWYSMRRVHGLVCPASPFPGVSRSLVPRWSSSYLAGMDIRVFIGSYF